MPCESSCREELARRETDEMPGWMQVRQSCGTSPEIISCAPVPGSVGGTCLCCSYWKVETRLRGAIWPLSTSSAESGCSRGALQGSRSRVCVAGLGSCSSSPGPGAAAWLGRGHWRHQQPWPEHGGSCRAWGEGSGSSGAFPVLLQVAKWELPSGR